MKTKLLSLTLLITLLASLIGAIMPTTGVSASGGGQQVWYIDSAANLITIPGSTTSALPISDGQQISTLETAADGLRFSTGHWRGHIALSVPFSGSVIIKIGSGEESRASPSLILAASTGFNFDIDTEYLDIPSGQVLTLYFIILSGGNLQIQTGKNSYFFSPPDSQAFPDPNLTTIYGLTLAKNGNGSTTPSVSATAYSFYINSVVPLLATADSGWDFSGWSGGFLSGTTNPTTITMDAAKAVTANFSSPVDLVLVTVTEPAVVDDTFEVVIQARCGSQGIVGVDAYLNFDPTKLAVVDINSGTAGIQITAGTTLTQPIRNIADNSTGYINYAAGVLGGSYPSGTFTVATIRFQALAQTAPTTEVSFSTAAPRQTYVSGDVEGTEVTGTLSGETYTIAAEINIDVSVFLQGANRPESAWVIPVTVKFFTPNANVLTATPLYSFTLNTAKVGNNGVIHCSGIKTGNYDISAKSSHTLVNVKKNVAIELSSTSVALGTLLEGNANNDDRVNIADFAILSAAYGQLSTDPDYNPLADFEGNGVVNIADFSLLSGNYNRISPIEVP